MAMVINNNKDAWISIGELNRNIKDTVREFEKITTGQNFNSAADDSAKYSVSEKMRTKIRALEQNQQNAKAGMLMLTMAQEGIQEQLDILKTIKARALQAADVSASDDDRQWIQSEIEDGFQKINDIAYEIEHNGINLLTGNVPIRETTVGWQLLLTPQILEDSDMNLIDDKYFELDGLEGPFDVFARYQSVDSPVSTLLNGNTSVNPDGGTDGVSAVLDVAIDSVSDLSGKGFYVRGVDARGNNRNFYYAIVDSSKGVNYNTSSYIKIDIANMDLTAAKNAVASAINNTASGYLTAAVTDTGISLTPTNTQTESNNVYLAGVSTNSTYKDAVAGHAGAVSTGLNLSGMKLSGGANEVSHTETTYEKYNPDDPDEVPHPVQKKVVDSPATTASLSVNVSGAADGSGFTFNGYYFKFAAGSNTTNTSDGVRNIGLNWNGSLTFGSFTLKMNNGQMTISSRYAGEYYNRYGIGADGYAEVESQPGTLVSAGLGALTVATQKTNGSDGLRSTYDIDLTSYDVSDTDLLEQFIAETVNNSLHLNYKTAANSSTVKTEAFEFIDTKVATSMDAIAKTKDAVTIDLNGLRAAVAGGKTIADAFIDLLSPKSSRFSKVIDDDKKILRYTSSAKGIYGNEDVLNTTADQLSHYTLDFKAWAEDNFGDAAKNVARYLDGKGFRFYCATDTEHWFNFVFSSGEDADRPDGISGAHLETIPIDVSALNDDKSITDAASLAKRLVETVYEQGQPYLVADNHNLYFAMDPDKGLLTVYDARKEDVLQYPERYPNVRQAGAKIGDGVLDDVQKTTVTIAANQRQLAIQHTDYSSQNILLHIPQTTMNHIFSLDPDWPDYSRFNVTTQTGRDYLLGKTNSGNSSSAALNKGLEYLFGALTTVAAQNSMLRTTETNLFTSYDNETEAESKIRDADIAKSFVAFTKSNMLAKAAETMLAQANQNASKILELLDRSKPVDKKSSDKKSDDKKSADKKTSTFGQFGTSSTQRDKKSSDKKSSTFGQVGTSTTQRDKNKTSAAQRNSAAQRTASKKK